MPKHILFDMDGTLVDSSHGILQSLQNCLEKAGLRSRVELTPSLIGPPLRTLIGLALGTTDLDRITVLEACFRQEYDSRGYLATHPWPGIPEALVELQEHGYRLHVVTNKRKKPAEQILSALGWGRWFDSVSTLDTSPGAVTKTDVVTRLLPSFGEPLSHIALVGDTGEDATAAQANGIAFVWVDWGYGRDVDLPAGATAAANPAEMIEQLLRLGPVRT